jgi:hypothetical protein
MGTFDEKAIAEYLSHWEIDDKGSPLSREELLPVNKRLRQFSAAQARRMP